MADQTKTTRRSFVKTVAAGAAGASLAMSMPAASYGRILGANDRVRLGVVGFSNRARGSLIPAFLQFSEQHNFDLVALSDTWTVRREQGKQMIEERTGQPLTVARNNEEMYETADLDAVIVASCDHQHAYHTIQAVQAGCDVYAEKPFANRMEDAREALRVVESSDKIVQIGTQRRSAPNYHMANEYIRSGQFGDLVMVEMSWNVNQPGRWRRPDLVAQCKEGDVDWSRYHCGRPYEAFDPRKYLEYRLFWPYSSGIPCQWMVHQIDTVHWFTDLPRPRSVVANGGIYKWNDGRANWDTMTAVFDYGPLDDDSEGFQVIYSSRQTNSAGGVKEVYYSNGGMLNLDTNRVTPDGGLSERHASAMDMEPNRLPEISLAEAMQVETAANTGVDNATAANMLNWMECVRDRKRPNADIRAGYNHSVALCMTIAAIHSGQRVTFDDKLQEVRASAF